MVPLWEKSKASNIKPSLLSISFFSKEASEIAMMAVRSESALTLRTQKWVGGGDDAWECSKLQNQRKYCRRTLLFHFGRTLRQLVLHIWSRSRWDNSRLLLLQQNHNPGSVQKVLEPRVSTPSFTRISRETDKQKDPYLKFMKYGACRIQRPFDWQRS